MQADVTRFVATAQDQPATLSPSSAVDGTSQTLSEARLSLSELSQSRSLEGKRDDLERLVSELNTQYERKNIALNFSIDDDTSTLVVKVIDQAADKVIRQIPPDAILALKKNIQSMMGTLFDEEA
jgi:flagellar protein FlaG